MFSFLQTTFPTLDIHLILQLIGIAGFMSYMAGFAALQSGFMNGNGPAYALTNVVGASLVLISLASTFNLASLLIQLSWIVIGCYGLARYKRAKTPQFKSRRAPVSEMGQTAGMAHSSLGGKEAPQWLVAPAPNPHPNATRITPSSQTAFRKQRSSAQMSLPISTPQPSAS